MKTVFITGGARGIGRAISDSLKYEGYNIISPSREECDLAELGSVQDFINKNTDLNVDILINNAGENKISQIQDITLSDWMRIQNVNMNSIFLLTQFFAKNMMKNRKGNILNISSCYSFLARPGRSAYSTSKAALNSFTRTCALEFGENNILVNSISPGFVKTDLTKQNNGPEAIKILESQTALKRLADPSEIAELALFLISEKNTYITGQNIIIDGGFSIQ